MSFIIDPQYQTPPAVAEYMVSMIPATANTILEPTPGMGNIVTALEKKGSYHITAPADYFTIPQYNKYDCIVMNPPFTSKSAYLQNAPAELQNSGMKIGYYMLQKSMEMSNHVIAIMPWFTLSDSDVRLRFLKAYGIKSLTALPRKTFEYVRIQTVIIELLKDYKEETIFKTFNF